MGAALVGATAAYHFWASSPQHTLCQEAVSAEEDNEFENWSATHKVRPQALFQPETTQDLQQVVAKRHASGMLMTPVTTTLSLHTALHWKTCSILRLIPDDS